MPNRPTILPVVVLAVSAAAVLCSSVAVTVPEPSPTEGIQQALSALADRADAKAERVATDLLADEAEGSWRAWLIVASAQHRRGRYAEAEKSYRQFLAMCRSQSERAYVMEQINRCRSAAAGPARPAAASELLWPQRRAKLAVVDNRRHIESSEHFVVRAYNSDLAKLLVEQAEIALTRICRIILTGQDYPHSVSIYVWPNIEEYHKHAVSAPEWAGGGFSLRRDKNGQLIRRIDLTQLDKNGLFDAAMLDRILPHEMCHLVQTEFFGDAPWPLALNEGLAMLAEASVDNRRVCLAGAALGGTTKIPLEQLLMMNRYEADNAAVFYAESFSLTAYLHRRMRPQQFHEMLVHIKAGCCLDEAVQRALYVPCNETFLKRLSLAWEAEAVRQWQFLKALEE